MAQPTNDIPHGNSDTPIDISRYTVPEAAQALGISPEAVRNRLSRGTLKSIKEKGTVYVLLRDDMVQSTADTSTNTSRYTTDTQHDISSEATGLLSAKDETIQVLKEQLEAERESNRENRRIIAGLTQRIPAIEAPPDEREAPLSASDAGDRDTVPPDSGEGKISFWRRLFG